MRVESYRRWAFPRIRVERATLGLAFVLLPDAKWPTGEAITDAFGRRNESGTKLRLVPNSVKTAAASVLQFEFGDGLSAFVAQLGAPVPNGEAESAVRFSVSALGTGGSLAKHEAQLVVTMSSPTMEHSPAARFQFLTKFTAFLAAVIEASNAVGVYWGEAGATHAPDFFTHFARDGEATRMVLWTGVSIAAPSSDRLSLLSPGMKQLGIPELLLVAPRDGGNEALSFFFDLLLHAARRGSAPPAGDTVGRSVDERLPVERVPSPSKPGEMVWKVALP